jgi:hypothetical protein
MTAPEEAVALYRYFDADDVLLYVGISNDPEFRWKAHLYGSSSVTWPKEAVRRTIEWHDSRPLALTAEEEAIRTENPRYNKRHNYDEAPFDPEAWPTVDALHKVPVIADLMRAEITNGRWTPSQRIPSLRTLADATDTSSRIVSKASVLLQAEGLLDFQSGHGVFVARARKPRPKLPHDWPQSVGFPG